MGSVLLGKYDGRIGPIMPIIGWYVTLFSVPDAVDVVASCVRVVVVQVESTIQTINISLLKLRALEMSELPQVSASQA